MQPAGVSAPPSPVFKDLMSPSDHETTTSHEVTGDGHWWWSYWNDHLAALILFGLILGIVCGLFFGEYCSFLSLIGDTFVGLLRMTVLPFIATTLLASLGRHSLKATRRLALVGSGVLIVLWAIALTMVALLPTALPTSASGSFYSAAMIDPATGQTTLPEFVPTNIFAALADNNVPAVIVFCVFVGAALATINHEHKMVLITQLDVLASALLKVASFIAKLAPIGVFGIAASTAGTISLADASRLQAYLILYCFGSLLLGFVILPLLVTTFTSLTYRQVLRIVRGPMITAFATGKLVIVLPMLIENTEELLAQDEGFSVEDKNSIELLFSIGYAFPHTGKILSMVFIPFAAWFYGSEISLAQYPSLLVSGLASYFAGPIVAIPYLLDQWQLPHDMFQLFLLTSVLGERIGDAVGAMHLAALTLVTYFAIRGGLLSRAIGFPKFAFVSVACSVLVLAVARATLNETFELTETKSQIIAQMQLIQQPVESSVSMRAEPNPVPPKQGESVLQRIRRRGVMRVGFNEDKLPFAFFNEQDQLVGFDVNLAHALAQDLGVTIEFVRFDRATLAEQLHDDHFDLVMSGLVGTLERSEAMRHSRSYLDVTLGLVAADYRAAQFKSLSSIRQVRDLRIGFVDLSRGFVARLKQALPEANLVEIRNNRDFFEQPDLSLDALLISAESGSAFTLLYPGHEVAVPQELNVKLPLFYVVAGEDQETRDFLDHWVELRKKDGTFSEYYQHWILGKLKRAGGKRWCIIRDVLRWVD